MNGDVVLLNDSHEAQAGWIFLVADEALSQTGFDEASVAVGKEVVCFACG